MPISTELLIGDVEPFSIVDFPDHIAAVAFLQGCPWRCPFCYNTSLQPLKAEGEPMWTAEKFFAFLERRKGFLDAVVFSGGEPLVQKGLKNAMKIAKDLGYTVGLHTGGYYPNALKEVLPFCDWVGLDIKGPSLKYQALTGGFAAFDEMSKSLDLLLESGVAFECRTTCDPRLLNADDLLSIGAFLKEKGVKAYYLQKYRPTEADRSTTDEMCETLISDAKAVDFLKENFKKFDVRR